MQMLCIKTLAYPIITSSNNLNSHFLHGFIMLSYHYGDIIVRFGDISLVTDLLRSEDIGMRSVPWWDYYIAIAFLILLLLVCSFV